MLDALMESAGTFWGTTILVGVAWVVVSCVFSLMLGSIFGWLEGPMPEDASAPQEGSRRGPRRAGADQDPEHERDEQVRERVNRP